MIPRSLIHLLLTYSSRAGIPGIFQDFNYAAAFFSFSPFRPSFVKAIFSLAAIYLCDFGNKQITNEWL